MSNARTSKSRTVSWLLPVVTVMSLALGGSGCITTMVHNGKGKNVALASAAQLGVGVALGLTANMCPEDDRMACLDDDGGNVTGTNMALALAYTVGVDALVAFVVWVVKGSRDWNMGNPR